MAARAAAALRGAAAAAAPATGLGAGPLMGLLPAAWRALSAIGGRPGPTDVLRPTIPALHGDAEDGGAASRGRDAGTFELRAPGVAPPGSVKPPEPSPALQQPVAIAKVTHDGDVIASAQANDVADALSSASAAAWGAPAWALALGTLLAVVVGAVLAEAAWTRLHYDLHKIPWAPDAVPVLGHLLLYWQHKDFTQWFLKFHDATRAPVLRVSVPHKRFLIIADPAITAAILARTGPDAVPRKVSEYSAFDKATGLHGHHSILTEQNEEMWVAVRKALSPAYTPAANRENYAAALKAYGDVGRRIAAAIRKQQAAAKVAPPGNGGAPDAAAPRDQDRPGVGVRVRVVAPPCADVQIDHHLLGAAIQTQVEGLFGMQPGVVDYLQAAEDIETAISIVHHYSAQPWQAVTHELVPWATATGRRLRVARLRLAGSCYEPIMRHVESCESPRELSLTACLRRLVDPRTGKAPCRERLLAEVGNQIMAPETAAHTISWILYCIATHPDAEAELLRELRGAGLPCNGDLEAAVSVLAGSFDPLKGLPFLGGVINEAMRLYPAGASASPRLTERPTRIGPYLVPAGVTVFPSLFVINNFSGSWGADAREFRPQRWADPAAGTDPASGAPRFLPFSAGPKNCIGLALGQVVVRSAVAMLLSTFSFKPAARMGDHAEVMSRSMLALTLKVEGGMWLSATPRA
ncbi:CYP3A10 [Scenedesmus sp. PABB004]|nr:CYP3A10 [Scenedesmus sp. PABB004]